MRHAEMEKNKEETESKTDSNTLDNSSSGDASNTAINDKCRFSPSTNIESSISNNDEQVGKTTIPSIARKIEPPAAVRNKPLRSVRRTQTNRGKGRGRARSRGKATGSIPLEPIECVESAVDRGRRNPHFVVLSESSSSSESEDEKSIPRKQGGFL